MTKDEKGSEKDIRKWHNLRTASHYTTRVWDPFFCGVKYVLKPKVFVCRLQSASLNMTHKCRTNDSSLYLAWKGESGPDNDIVTN